MDESRAHEGRPDSHQEIERKFLVLSDAYKRNATGVLFRQGYLSTEKERVVRVRQEGSEAKLAIKGLTVGFSRIELEYDIPIADANILLRLCKQPIIEKTRWKTRFEGHTFEVDEFHGVNAGLTVAEVELATEDEPIARPEWLGAEVTHDSRYFNSNLVAHPYTTWSEPHVRT